jgi:uncharacterized repeat protein (TIGR02543 family)
MALTLSITVIPSGSSGGVVINPKTYTYVSPGKVSFPGPTQVILRAQAPNIPFDHWEGDLGRFTTAEISFYMTKNVSMTAYFNEVPPTQYTLRTSVSPAAGGVIDPVGSMKVNEYTMFPVQLRLASGYSFVRWSGKESNDTVESNPTYQVIHVYMNHDREITAIVQSSGGGGGGGGVPNYTLTTTVVPVEGGDIIREPSGTTYPENTAIKLTARPRTGYRFIAWTGDLAGSPNPAQFIITRNTNVGAAFEKVAVGAAEFKSLSCTYSKV